MLERERQDFSVAFQELNEQFQSTSSLLGEYYQEAVEEMENGRYLVNTGIIKELRMYLSQITKIAVNAGNGINLFLLTMSENQDTVMPEPNLDKYIEKYKDSSELPLSKSHLEDRNLNLIRARCGNATSISLISNSLKREEIINDEDIVQLKHFKRMSSLSLRNSNISEEGLRVLSEGFESLKQIDISKCKFVGRIGLNFLAGYKYVSIKASQIENIDQHDLISLIASSYNLNYLEINNIPHFDYHQLLKDIQKTYLQNKLNFKWLQIQCNLGTVLLLNKLAYLTHLTTVDSISDREVQILIGEQPLLDGLFISCCENLHSDTIKMLIKKCSKLKRLGLRRFINLSDALVGDLVAAMPKLEYLDLGECCSLTSRALIQAANQLSKLKEINLSKCFSVSDEGVEYLIEKMPALKVIDLSYCKHITDAVVFKACDFLPELTSLSLAKCEQVTNESISYLSEKLISLKVLVLNGCEGLTDVSLALVAMRLRKLVRLEVEWCGISQKCVDFIAQNLNELQILNLNYCHAVYDQALIGLSKHASNLQSLSLASCDKITNKGFLRLFGSLKKLRELDLRECGSVDDLAISHLCENSRRELTFLDLGWCKSVTDGGILHLSQFQQQLHSLNLSGCSQISDSAVTWLCSSMPHLEYLNLTLCDRITDASVFEISKNLLNLRVLFLSELKKITDASVSSLANVHNLEELHLSGCEQVTSSSLIALLHNLQKLQCLNIGECSNIFAESLLLLVQRMRNLQKFYIASLDVSDKFLEMVGEYMRRIQVISMQFCRKITDEGVLKMVYKTPSLLKIDLQNTGVSEKTKKIIFDELSTRSLYDVVI